MWQKVDDKYHWVLSGDEFLAPNGQQAMTYCRQAVVVDRTIQTPYVSNRNDRCDFCNSVTNLLHTSGEEAIRYSLPEVAQIDVLERALEFTSSRLTLRKAIERRIRKLEKVM